MTGSVLPSISLSERPSKGQSIIVRCLCIAAVCLVLITVWLGHEKTSATPVVTMKSANDAEVHYFFNPYNDLNSCLANLPQLAGAIRTSCSECSVTSECQQDNNKIAPASSIYASKLVLPFKGGFAIFLSNDDATNSASCNASFSALKASGDPVALGTNEACSKVSDDRLSTNSSGSRTDALALLGAIWPLVTLLACLLLTVGFSYFRHSVFDEQSRLTTGHRQASALATALSDIVSVYLVWACLTANGVDDQTFTVLSTFNNQTIACVAILVLWFSFGTRHYQTRQSLHDELGECTKATIAIGLIHSLAVAFTESAKTASPLILWTAVTMILPVCRYLVRCELDDRGLWRRPVLVIGRGDNARVARSAITNDFTLGYKVLELPPLAPKTESGNVCPIESLAYDVHQAGLVANKVRIVAALDSLQSDESRQVLNELLQMDRSIDVVPSLTGLPILGARVSQFFGHELIMLSIQNKLARSSHRFFKRVFDIIVSVLLIAILSPLLLYLVVRIRADGGPAFFFQERVGLGGKGFRCMKFRSMHVDAEEKLQVLLESNSELRTEWQRNFKLSNDPRVTSIGAFIRAKSLDELPQLFNVLLGQMSLVGPRPLLFNELDRYGNTLDLYTLVTPGITGVWQVSGRSDTTFEDRAEMDEWYIRNWSLFYDITCLVRTINVLIDNDGAY